MNGRLIFFPFFAQERAQVVEGVSGQKDLEHQIDDAAPPRDSRRLRRTHELVFVDGVIMTIILASVLLPARNHRPRRAAES